MQDACLWKKHSFVSIVTRKYVTLYSSEYQFSKNINVLYRIIERVYTPFAAKRLKDIIFL